MKWIPVSGLLLILLALGACEGQSAPLSTSTPASTAIGNPTPTPSSPSSVAKIEAAEKTGQIDHDSALLYQLYAALDFQSLPREYQGDDSREVRDATGVLGEIRNRLDQMPAAIRTKVQPFFKRPTDPQSFWNKRMTARTPGQRIPGLAMPNQEIRFDYVDAQSTPIRVWYAEPLGQSERELALRLAAEIEASRMWEKERWAMLGHNPCSDARVSAPQNGGDGRLDIYLIYPATGLDWNGRQASLKSAPQVEGGELTIADGVTISEGPGGTTCAVEGFIGLNAAVAGNWDRFRLGTAHELFHAFQLSFFRAEDHDRRWWMEASATWAEDLVYPQLNREQRRLDGAWAHVPVADPRAAYPGGAEGPLDNLRIEYGTYIWAFYLRQQAGGDEQSIGRLWQASQDKPPIEVMHNLPNWNGKFKEFALWNLNESPVVKYMDNGVPIPRTALAQDTRCLAVATCMITVGRHNLDVRLEHASLSYDGLAPIPGVKQAIFHLDGLPNQEGRGVQAVITLGREGEPGYQQKVEDWSDRTERKFCLDREDLTKLILVVSNGAMVNRLEGEIGVEGLAEACPQVGTITVHDHASITKREPDGESRTIIDQQVSIEVVNGRATASIVFDNSTHSESHMNNGVIIVDDSGDETTHAEGQSKTARVKVELYGNGEYTVRFSVQGIDGIWTVDRQSAGRCVIPSHECGEPQNRHEHSNAPVYDLGGVDDEVDGKLDPSRPHWLSGSATTIIDESIGMERTITWQLYY